MKEAVLQRLLIGVLVVVGVSLLVFMIQHWMPGDPVKMMLVQHESGTAPTPSANVTDEMYEKMKHELGLDRPLHVQYLSFVWNALHGDLGHSFRSDRPVAEIIGKNITHTVRLAALGLGLATFLGIVLGILAAVNRDTWIDSGVMVVAVLGTSLPSFWLALLLILVFGIKLPWFPFMGVGTWRHEVLPMVSLGAMGAGLIARLTRSSLVEILGEEYIKTARAKGLKWSYVVFKHALKNALLPVVTVIGLQFGGMLGGTVITETVFGRPGIGSLALKAIMQKDFPLTQGVILMSAVAYTISNLAIDIIYMFLDPRISYN